MIRFIEERGCNLILLWWCITGVVVQCELNVFGNRTDFQKLSCIYNNVEYENEGPVKTKEPCLNCTCNQGSIICHLRVCFPVPKPPPAGCFILHRKDSCCPELVCNEDNIVLFDGLEARSRPSSYDSMESDFENFTKTVKNWKRDCLLNGMIFAEGSPVSSSECKYCYCMKGRERCIKPKCVLQLNGCTPEYNNSCCPVKYNCNGSDNVTIVSTELSYANQKTPESNNDQSSSYRNKIAFNNREDIMTHDSLENKFYIYVNESIPSENRRKYTHATSTSSITSVKSSTEYTDPVTTTDFNHDESSMTTRPSIISDPENSTFETMTEISTSISLIKTELLVLKEAQYQNSSCADNQTSVQERKHVLDGLNETMAEWERNFTSKNESKPILADIEAILNIAKKKQESDYELLDYDEPTLPPSLPNLKIIPFVAADALDKPKDAIIENREDSSHITDETDNIFLDSSSLQAGQFSPPVKTEGGFIPREPILDGPYFESKYGGIYQTTENRPLISKNQPPLPSITESSKIIENMICTHDYLTYRHGELISEPKACNMCLCLYGQIVCQEPKCPPVKPNCRRIKYNLDVNNCCGEIICDINEDLNDAIQDSPSLAIPTNIEFKTTESSIQNKTESHSFGNNLMKESITSTSFTTVPSIPGNPTYMTIKVKTKNNQTKTNDYKISIASTPRQPEIKTFFPSLISSNTETTRSTTPVTVVTETTTHPKIDIDYDSGFSFENMLSFLFDESPVVKKTKNVTSYTPTTTSEKSNTIITYFSPITTFTPAPTVSVVTKTSSNAVSIEATTKFESKNNTPETSTSAVSSVKTETDSAIYRIKNENSNLKNVINYTEDANLNSIQQINSYYVPPLGNFEEVILNPTKKPFINKKPSKTNSQHSTTHRPHTTAKVIPVSRPYVEKSVPQIVAGDPGAVTGLLKLSGCNIFGKMYRIGKIIPELSAPCLQCMCAEVGVHCVPLKC